MYYLIEETLKETNLEQCKNRENTYVALVSEKEFVSNKEIFDMGIDIEIELEHLYTTKVEVNFDSLTGSFSIPDRANVLNGQHKFAFALDERGIAFINDDGTAQKIIQKISTSKKWKNPSLERFIYDFLEEIISGDLAMLEKYEKEMDDIEDSILAGKMDSVMERMTDMRSEILDIRTHYEQLIDFGQELEENENGFFLPQNLRFFHLFTERVIRLQDIVTSLKEHTMQVRDLYHTQMDVKQNRIMTVLTVITSIFMPLTLIAGWYGMNFKFMPELDNPYAYPAVCIVSVIIVVLSLVFFKIKKWL